jgi:hypothetical protein
LINRLSRRPVIGGTEFFVRFVGVLKCACSGTYMEPPSVELLLPCQRVYVYLYLKVFNLKAHSQFSHDPFQV